MRSIVHLDADAFFASVEQSADPRLRGKPIAVGGEKRGIIASASYEARKMGIFTPMPTVMARRLCPKLILLPGDFEKYELFSRLMFSYAYDVTPDVEIGSIDEGYFDLTGVRQPAVSVAEKIRNAIRQSLKLPVSEGVGTSKLVSQIASKLKKPSAFEFVPPGNETLFLAPLEVRWLPGVGPKTASQLNSAGLARIGQVARTPVELLNLLVGGLAPQLHTFSLGIDERPVVPVSVPAKSFSEQETFDADTTDEPFLDATLRRMADKLMAKVRADHKSIRTVTVKVRYNDMDDQQASESLREPTDLESDIYGKASTLLRRAWERRVSLRMVSLKLSNVYEGVFGGGLRLDQDSAQHDAQERLAGIVDQLREKYGRSVLLRGHDFVLRDQPSMLETARHPATSPGSYRAAIVQRQRLANKLARSSPAPELRFRQRPASAPQKGSKTSYPPLNVHSFYSFLDSTLSIEAIIELAKKHSIPALAITDRNNLHGAVQFSIAAAEAGIKPVIGAEIIWEGEPTQLFAENARGYANLCQLLSLVPPCGPQEGRSSLVPEISETQLAEHAEGLLAVGRSAKLAHIFPGRFYFGAGSPEDLEKAPRGVPCVAMLPIHYGTAEDRLKYDILQSIRTLTLLRQAHPGKRPGGQHHFYKPDEVLAMFVKHPELLAHTIEIVERCNFALRHAKPQFPGYAPPDGSTPAEFLRRLVLQGLSRRYPEGWKPSMHNGTGQRITLEHLKRQVEEELTIITDVGYEEYFLIMWDILQECRRRGIDWITRGSAADSLACYCLGISGVCPIRFDLYFRRFLNKDRMALNKLPDIDVDFPHDRKDDVIDLIFEKFGKANTAVVGGFSTFQARSAFAEVAKVLGVSEHQVRRITERFPYYSHMSELPAAMAETQECRDLPMNEEPYATALAMGQFLDGFPRYPKMHPCGVVLSRRPMHEITPSFISAKGYPTAHLDMDSVEEVGLVKMDILAQGGLAVMRDVRNTLTERHTQTEKTLTTDTATEVEKALTTREQRERRGAGNLASNTGNRVVGIFDRMNMMDRISTVQPPKESTHAGEASARESVVYNLDLLDPWEDPEVWELIASGGARAVHHIESPAMISLCRMCNVRDIDTLIAIVSVIRPGAANESHKMEFARRYQGLSPVRYPHPSLEPCLRSTYGLVVYEEHILQMCEAFAGLPPGRADILRRALGKEKTEVIEQIHTEFLQCAREHGRGEQETEEVWKLITGFRGYAFCKAHSTAYGVEAYQSAWLKRYFPAEFMAAVLSNGKGFYRPLVYILECHRLGIPLLPPSINSPGPEFSVTDRGEIRVPVLQVKGLTARTTETILSERRAGPFLSLANFYVRVAPNADEMDALIRVGAFDEFGAARAAQYWDFKSLEASAVASGHANARPGSGKQRISRGGAALGEHALPATHRGVQLWLLPPGGLEKLPSVPLEEPTRVSRLQAEEELLGYTASGHPLDLFPDIAWETYCPVNRLGEFIKQTVVTCGMVIEQRLYHQVTGEPMKFITIADHTGIVETELFARTYRSYGLNTVRYRVLEIEASVDPFENARGFTLRVHRAGKPRSRPSAL